MQPVALTHAALPVRQLPLYLNRALCNLHFHDWDSSLWDVNKVGGAGMRQHLARW